MVSSSRPPPAQSAPPPRVEPHDASELPTTPLTPSAPPPRARDSVDMLIESFAVASKSDQQMSRELKAMVGIDATAPPTKVVPRDPVARDSQVEALLALSEKPPSTRPPAREKREKPREKRDAEPREKRDAEPEPSFADDRQLPTGPSQIRARVAARTSRKVTVVLAIALVVLALGAIALWRLKPGIFTGRTQENIDAEKARIDSERQKQALAQRTAACKATLVVTDVPAHAEVLLRAGQAPIDVDHMPVGARLEFVATAEGYAPKRSVVPAGASWDTGTDGKPRIELPVQLEKSKMKPGQIDIWPAGEPGVEAGGNGPPGRVHVVSSPKGAEVWLLAGNRAEVSVEQLPCDADVDVLVAGPTTFRKRLHVAAAEFKETDSTKGARAARVSAK
jgi:hypothetical protein